MTYDEEEYEEYLSDMYYGSDVSSALDEYIHELASIVLKQEKAMYTPITNDDILDTIMFIKELPGGN